MEHWLSDYLNELEQTINGTGWTMTTQPSGKGPAVFTHDDGTEVSIVDPPTPGNHYTVEYKLPNEDPKLERFALDDAVEWLILKLEQHD